MNKKFFYLTLPLLLLLSCSQETLTEVTDDTLSVEEVSATTQSLLIDKDAVSLTSVDAKNVAALFLSKNGGVSSRSASVLASESTSVETILDSTTSEPLLYVINWANDGGFVVVSASKKCFPVACYSETGSFSLDADPASKSYLEGYKSLVRDALNDTSDSLRARYALEWSVFEKSGTAIDTSLYGDFFYMNMGWGGDNNGWYRSNAYIDDDGHSYLYNQKIILIEEGD